jgi:head-tail adaptor
VTPASTFLHDRQPTRLRGLAFLALSERGWPLAGTVISDGGGGGTTTWVAGGTVPCRIDPLARAGDERVVGGRIDDRSTHRITVPGDTPVFTTGRFQVADRGVFEVTAVQERTDQQTKAFEVVSAS